jgi:hypothetical protein
MMIMTDTTINSDFHRPIISVSDVCSQRNCHRRNRFSYKKPVPTRRLSTKETPLIKAYQSTISDTNKDVLEKKIEPLEKKIKTEKSKVISRIKGLKKYQQGWYDGIEGSPASEQTIQDALIFANNLDFNNIHTPYISLARDGEVSFWWDLKTIKLGLGFYGDGTYSYYAKLENGKEFFGDDKDSSLTLPLEILEKLKK